MVPGLWIVAWLAGREPLPRTPLNATLLLLFCMVLVSLWATYDIAVSLPKVSGMALGIGVFFALAREAQRSRGWSLSLLAFLGIGLGIAALGVFSTSWFTSKIILFNPIMARLPKLITGLQGAESGLHPNELAGALLWVLPLMMALSIALVFSLRPSKADGAGAQKTDSWGKIGNWRIVRATILCLVVTFFSTAVFLLSQSRGAYIGLALTLLVMILIALPPRWRRISLAILALLVIVFGILLTSHWETVRVWATGSDLASDPAFSLNTLDFRLEIWPRAIYAIQDFPLTGMGMNTFRKVLPVLYPVFTISPEFDIGHAHNEFLQAALDLGIPGLIAFIALCIVAFWMLRDIWKELSGVGQPGLSFLDSPTLAKAIVLGLGGGLFAHLLYGLTDAVALGAKPGLLFWMLLGLIAGLYQQMHSKEIYDE